MAKFEYPPQAVQDELRATAEAIVNGGKGILAADESNCKFILIVFSLINILIIIAIVN